MSRIPLFWQRWMLAAAAASIVFGLAFMVMPEVTESIYETLLFSQSQIHTRFSEEARGYIRFANGVLGAVMVGWLTGVLVLAAGPFRRGERSAWLAIAASIGVWFVVDSGYSMATGYWQNAAVNVVFALLFAIPLAATYKYTVGDGGR